MRIDPLLELWQEHSPRRDALSKIVGIDPFDANTWKEFIKRLFDLAAANQSVGIKQLKPTAGPFYTYREQIRGLISGKT
jgi:hypothetical protein